MSNSAITLVRAAFGEAAADRIAATVFVDPEIGVADAAMVSRATMAMALTLALFDDLLARSQMARGYVDDVVAAGARVTFDHGALRTIRFPEGGTGVLPAGELAFRRILEPLGYCEAGLYPLPRLHMTGRAYAHADHPETIPQFFVSELHVGEFSPGFGDAAQRVFGASRDPIDAPSAAALDTLAGGAALTLDVAAPALRILVAAFDRHHREPALADYEALKAESAEAAWIATEGNAFNHATDRVADVDQLAIRQRALGRPIKDAVERSASGRVRQTAFRADSVDRGFVDADGGRVMRPVPGSFYEFITRDIDPATQAIDLRFDSGNATGIFGMTRASEAA